MSREKIQPLNLSIE